MSLTLPSPQLSLFLNPTPSVQTLCKHEVTFNPLLLAPWLPSWILSMSLRMSWYEGFASALLPAWSTAELSLERHPPLPSNAISSLLLPSLRDFFLLHCTDPCYPIPAADLLISDVYFSVRKMLAVRLL